MKLLIVTPYLPYPLQAGGHTRIFHLMKHLGRMDVSILLVILAAKPIDWATVGELENHLPHVRVRWVPLIYRWPQKLLFYILTLLGLGHLGNRPVKQQLEKLIEEENPDLLQVEFTQLGRFLPRCRIPAILVYIEFRFRVLERELASLPPGGRRLIYQLRAWFVRKEESAASRGYSACICMSHVDARLLRDIGCRIPIYIVENGVDLDEYAWIQPSAPVMGLYMLASFTNGQNLIGFDFFFDRVWPLLQPQAPDMAVIGKNLNSFREWQLEKMGVRYLGFVPTPELRQIVRGRILVVPLLSGSGTRLKIVEAMAMGTPVISTAVGAEGIEVEDGKHLLLADTPEEFAAAIRRLLTDAALNQQLASNARGLVKEKYEWNNLAIKQHEIYGLCLRPHQNRMAQVNWRTQ